MVIIAGVEVFHRSRGEVGKGFDGKGLRKREEEQMPILQGSTLHRNGGIAPLKQDDHNCMSL